MNLTFSNKTTVLLSRLDPRWYQILFLGSFLFYGIVSLNWASSYNHFITTISVALFVQLTCEFFTNKRYSSWKSGLITALGLCLLLKTNTLWVSALAASLAISSKYLIKGKGKHLFNPANFGIIAAILLTNEAWISPGQWGNTPMLVFFFSVTAFSVLTKVNRIDSSLSFLIVFFVLEYFRTVWYLGWDISVLFHKISNGSFLLFAFFMITDPRTTPNARKSRIIWSSTIAVITFMCSNYMYLHSAPIWVLFFTTPFTVMLDRWISAPIFQWNSNVNNQLRIK